MSNYPPGVPPGGPTGSYPPPGAAGTTAQREDPEDLAKTLVAEEIHQEPTSRYRSKPSPAAPTPSPSAPPAPTAQAPAAAHDVPLEGLRHGGFGAPPGASSYPPPGVSSEAPPEPDPPSVALRGAGLPLPPIPPEPRPSQRARAHAEQRGNDRQRAATKDGDKKNYIIELCAAVVIGLGTLLGAFSAYQSALWSGNCLTNYNQGAITMTQASASMLLGVQTVMIDGIMFIESGSQRLLAEGDEQPSRAKIAKYIEQELMLEDFKIPLAWAEKFNQNPFEFPGLKPGSRQHSALAKTFPEIKGKAVPSYEQMRLGQAQELMKKGQALFAQGQRDNANGDAFTLVTVFFTIVLFFGGLATVMRRFVLKTVFLAMAVAILAMSSFRLLSQPFAKAAPPASDTESPSATASSAQ